MGTFGRFPYGSYIAGKLVVVVEDGCLPIAPVLSGSIYLIARGNCLFKTKVMHAEQAGARAVIIYNQFADSTLVTMAGRPTNITIPSLFISYQHGLALFQHADASLNLTFSLFPKLDSTFSLAFSMSANDTVLAAVIPTSEALNMSVKPVFALSRCQNCTNYGFKTDYCLGGGRYCAYYADKNGEMMQEAIRQQCIYSLNASAYLPYLAKWFGECQMATASVCQAGLIAAGLSTAAVQTCFSNSYRNDIYESDNTVLSDLYKDVTKLQPRGVPTLMMGEESYFGELTDAYLQEALYKNTTKCTHDNERCLARNCSAGCSEEMKMSGHCYPACNNEKCGFGNGTCLCAPDCTPTLLSNSVCNPACNTLNCSFDMGVCSECSPNCTNSMLLSGLCYDQCNTKACDYSHGNCRCAEECPRELLENDVCDSGCDNADCNYDTGLCSLYQDNTEEDRTWVLPVAISMSMLGV